MATYTFFADYQDCIYAGSELRSGFEESHKALGRKHATSVAVFIDMTGEVTEFDPTESPAEFEARIQSGFGAGPPALTEQKNPGPGRPRLGVVSREVSLLPRHWEWLNSQPGKASATLRRLVEEARRRGLPEDEARQARDAAYRVMSQLAGAEKGYEKVSRALYAGRFDELDEMIAGWRPDVRDYLSRLFERAARRGI